MIAAYQEDQGFTLLEVVTSVAILSLTFAVLLPMFGSAPRRMVQAADAAYAMQLANSNLELELLKQDWLNLPVSGSVDNWSWSVSGEPYGEPVDGETGYPFLLTSNVWRADESEDLVASFERIVWVASP